MAGWLQNCRVGQRWSRSCAGSVSHPERLHKKPGRRVRRLKRINGCSMLARQPTVAHKLLKRRAKRLRLLDIGEVAALLEDDQPRAGDGGGHALAVWQRGLRIVAAHQDERGRGDASDGFFQIEAREFAGKAAQALYREGA